MFPGTKRAKSFLLRLTRFSFTKFMNFLVKFQKFNFADILLQMLAEKLPKFVEVRTNAFENYSLVCRQKETKVMRPCDVPEDGIVCDLLWSDPDQDVVGSPSHVFHARFQIFILASENTRVFLPRISFANTEGMHSEQLTFR